jgi:hypothetical protein
VLDDGSGEDPLNGSDGRSDGRAEVGGGATGCGEPVASIVRQRRGGLPGRFTGRHRALASGREILEADSSAYQRLQLEDKEQKGGKASHGPKAKLASGR